MEPPDGWNPGDPLPLEPEAADALQEEIEALCREHGNTWPHSAATDLSRRFAVSRKTIHERRRAAMARLAGRQEEEK